MSWHLLGARGSLTPLLGVRYRQRMQNAPVPVVVNFQEKWKDVLEHDQAEQGAPLHVLFGYSENKVMLSITSHVAQGMVGYSPIELYFDKDTWRQFQEAVARHDPLK
jgi:hypothetical protein